MDPGLNLGRSEPDSNISGKIQQKGESLGLVYGQIQGGLGAHQLRGNGQGSKHATDHQYVIAHLAAQNPRGFQQFRHAPGLVGIRRPEPFKARCAGKRIG
jgi:hypothetical protein